MNLDKVRPKKALGQHFLTDENTARKISETLTSYGNYKKVLEVGPGMGVLTKYLLKNPAFETFVAEIDGESVTYLKEAYPTLSPNIIEGDFLKYDLEKQFPESFAIIGNYPYNISSQIVFRILEYRHLIPEATGMFQKEVAQRIAEKPGSKVYGILSALTQAFYKVEYLFTVNEGVFNPPPKVKSGVIRLQRLETPPDCNHKLLFHVVKTSFNQRRKMLSNSLKGLVNGETEVLGKYKDQRPEQLSPTEFVEICNMITPIITQKF